MGEVTTTPTDTDTATAPEGRPDRGGGTGEIQAVQPPAGLTTTVRVHRATRGETPWWHGAVVIDVFRPLDLDGLRELSAGITHVARVGATAVLLHAPDLDPAGADEVAAIDALVRRAHQRGLHILVGVSGRDAPEGTADAVAWHRRRIADWLDRGVDGIDLVEVQADREHRHPGLDISEIHALVAERTEDGIVSGALRADDAEDLLTHLREDWWHVTRDDRLSGTPWDADAWRTAVTESFGQRDGVGAPMAWTLSNIDGVPEPPRGWGALDDELLDQRWRAASLFIAGLPGVMFLRHGEAVGLTPSASSLAEAVRAIAAAAQEQVGDPTSRFERYRKALRLRGELHLATGPLAWVGEDVAGSGCLAYLNRDVLVALNMGTEDVVLPPHRELLHLSGHPSATGRLDSLPPDTAAWLAL